MQDILLIHGGSHGAWCWEEVIRELGTLGRMGYALDLPGGGDDQTPRESITLDAYISAVNDFIRQKELNEFVIVGHSLAGLVLPEVIAAHREKIREAIYIASFILDRGERGIDLVAPERRPDYYRLADISPDRSLMLPYEFARERFFNDLGEEEAEAAYQKLTPQPLGPYLDAAAHGASEFAPISRYIICRDDRNLPHEFCTAFAKKLGGKVGEIDAGHDAMLSQPDVLARMLAGG